MISPGKKNKKRNHNAVDNEWKKERIIPGDLIKCEAPWNSNSSFYGFLLTSPTNGACGRILILNVEGGGGFQRGKILEYSEGSLIQLHLILLSDSFEGCPGKNK